MVGFQGYFVFSVWWLVTWRFAMTSGLTRNVFLGFKKYIQ